MKILLFSLLINSAIMVLAQDGWKVYHNKTELLKSSQENESKNIIAIASSSLNKPGELVISYLEKKPLKDWIRIIAVFDKNDNEILKKEAVRLLKISNKELKKLFTENSSLRFFTWSLPTDPQLAERIRIRRVHLCTIELK